MLSHYQKQGFVYAGMPPLRELEMRKLGIRSGSASLEESLNEQEEELAALEADTILIKIEQDQAHYEVLKSAIDLGDFQTATKEVEYFEALLIAV